MTLFGIRVFADVINVRFKIISSWIRWSHNPVRVSLEETEKERTQGHREEGDVSTKAGIGVMHLQGKGQRGRRATARSWERGGEWILPQGRQKEQPWGHLDFWAPEP